MTTGKKNWFSPSGVSPFNNSAHSILGCFNPKVHLLDPKVLLVPPMFLGDSHEQNNYYSSHHQQVFDNTHVINIICFAIDIFCALGSQFGGETFMNCFRSKVPPLQHPQPQCKRQQRNSGSPGKDNVKSQGGSSEVGPRPTKWWFHLEPASQIRFCVNEIGDHIQI